MMKQCRRRRHLRPRPSRAQINQQLNRTRRLLNLFRAEWLFEAQQDQPRAAHLRLVHDRIVEINDKIASLEQQ
jgi:hypothetical protein